MTRILKALTVSAFAVMAMGALFASAANAQGLGIFTSGNTNPFSHTSTQIHAVQEGAITANYFESFGQKIHCTNALSTFTGSADGTNRAVTITPHYTGCFVPEGAEDKIGLIATVTMNGCDYTFNQPTSVPGSDTTWTGTVSLVCPAEKEVAVEIYTREEVGNDINHGTLKLCEINLKSNVNQNLAGVEYHNIPRSEHEVEGKKTVTTDDLTVTVDTTNKIIATEKGLCGAKEDKEADYVSTLTLTSGTPAAAGNDDLWISTGNTGTFQ